MNTFIQAVFTLLITAITVFVIPWIKSKVDQDKLDSLQTYAEYAVRYAEQVFKSDEFLEKKNYVYAYVLDKANSIGAGLNEKDIDMMVEGVVNLVKH